MYETFSAEWTRGSDALMRYCSRRTANADRREDLVQQTWVPAWEEECCEDGANRRPRGGMWGPLVDSN